MVFADIDGMAQLKSQHNVSGHGGPVSLSLVALRANMAAAVRRRRPPSCASRVSTVSIERVPRRRDASPGGAPPVELYISDQKVEMLML